MTSTAMRPDGSATAIIAAAAATLAASLSLAPLFATQNWFWPAAAAVAAIAAVGYLARRYRLSAVAVHSAQIIAGLATLILLFVRDAALLGVVPTPGSLSALAGLLRDGLALADTSAPPVATDPALVLLATGGTALIYLLVDLLGVTLRSPVAAGIPLLGLIAVAVIVAEESAGWPVFALTAAAWLSLIVADSGRRLDDWGVEIGHAQADPTAGPRRIGGLAAGGRRAGALAIAAAIAVPALLPTATASSSGWFGSGSGGGIGGDTVETVNPYVDIQDALTRGDDSDVLTYRTSDGEGSLLRLATLDVFLADIWQQSALQWPARQQAADGIPVITGAAATATPVQIQVDVGPLDENRLPLPYPTTRVLADGDWRYEASTQNVLSPDQRTEGLRYVADALRLDIDPSALATGESTDADLQRYLTIPQTTSRIVTQTALDVTANATTPFDQAVALQEWFRSDFDYDVAYRPGDGDPMVAFLNDRRGYCQQFASTMALMARSLGIPARVNVGFSAGDSNPDGSWTVSWHDTHAWPELYFGGAGWLAMEPTPRGGAGFAAPSYTEASTTPTPITPTPTGPGAAAGHERLDPETKLTDPDALDPEAAEAPAAAWTNPWLWAGLAAMALLIPAAWRQLLRFRRRRVDSAEAAWAEWRDTWVDLGGDWTAGWTPRQAAAATAERWDEPTAQLVSGLSTAVEKSRYAPGSADGVDPVTDRAEVAALRRQAMRQAGWRRRWVARLAPRSTWGGLLRGAEQGVAAVDRTERNLAELARR